MGRSKNVGHRAFVLTQRPEKSAIDSQRSTNAANFTWKVGCKLFTFWSYPPG